MRLITWKCRVGGFRNKAKYIAPLRPDILAVQELEPIDRIDTLAGDAQPTFRDRRADPAFPRRAIGVFSYTDTQLTPVDLPEPLFSFRRYEACHGEVTFNVIAVWPWQTKSSKTAYRQAHEGLGLHASWIGQRPTVILGDFNTNASFAGSNWRDLLDLLKPLGLVSAYHSYSNEEPGREQKPTHFHKGSETRSFHLDYCFIPQAWVPHLKSVEVGTYADWHTISDHAPVVVDLDV
jgi:hypothetical protein